VDFDWPEEVRAVQQEARALAAAAAADRPIREEAWAVGSDREFSQELGRRRWLGMTWPEAEGGHGRSPLERFVVTEELIAAGAPLARSWVADRQIGPTLLAHGSPDQRRRYLPDMVAGRACWSIGLSEPDAGSDVASISTRARLDGGHYVLDGRKVWTTFGAEAEHCYVVARTDPAAPKHLGLSELIVDLAAPGVTVRPIKDMSGAAHFCETTFDGVRVPVTDLVGTPGNAFRQIMGQLEHERGGIDRLVSNRALYLDARAALRPSDRVLRDVAARLECEHLAARLQVLRLALGQAPAGHSSVIKVTCTELEQNVSSFAARVLGPSAMLAGRTARAVCYAPAYTIQGGTNTILRNVIGERILGLPR
jgi:alkylation response protein AidB-like acyl-CoA dehydrogenase